jgi:hypothetical protein
MLGDDPSILAYYDAIRICTTRKGPVNEDLRAFFKSEALREIKRGLPRRPFLKRDETGC